MAGERRKADPSTALGMTKRGTVEGKRQRNGKRQRKGKGRGREKAGRTENSRRKGKSRTTSTTPRDNKPSPNHRPLLVIPSAVEGSAVCLSPATNLYMSSSIGHAEEPFVQQEMAGESLLAAKRLLLRATFLCSSDAGDSVRIRGWRKAQSRSLDCARDDKRGSSRCTGVGGWICTKTRNPASVTPGSIQARLATLLPAAPVERS